MIKLNLATSCQEHELIKEYLQDLLVLSDNEKEFVKEFTNKNYRPELLFEDKDIVERISAHPMALWRVRENNN